MNIRLAHHKDFFLQLLLLLCFSILNVVTVVKADQFEVVRLDYNNYDETTQGLTVFIKFFASWCGHCKQMANDWERLAEIWNESNIGLVAEVDCTDNAQQGGNMLCNHFGIESFPTLKYGDPSDLDEYTGKRSLQEMTAFAEEYLVPFCSPTHLKLCDDEALSYMKNYLDLSIEELHKLIRLEEEKLKESKEKFDATVEELTKEYEVAEEEKRLTIKEVSNGDLYLMKQIILKKQIYTRTADREIDDGDEIYNEL